MTWQSYHVHLEGGLGAAADTFLVQDLVPEVRLEEDAGRIRRFFFLRYSEGGPHLRLRFQASPGRGGSVRSAEDSLEHRLARRASKIGGRLESRAYDRTAHYFGDSVESVYAELLNDATSRLALALLQSFGPERRGERFVATTCALGVVLEAACGAGAALELAVEDGRRFALRTGHRLGLGPEQAADGAGRQVAPVVVAAWPRVRAGLPGRLVRPVAHLLRRSRRRGEGGREVAVHALHLLCNKTGFSLHEEHESFATLATAWPTLKGMST